MMNMFPIKLIFILFNEFDSYYNRLDREIRRFNSQLIVDKIALYDHSIYYYTVVVKNVKTLDAWPINPHAFIAGCYCYCFLKSEYKMLLKFFFRGN